jgi:hypothetical protein
MYRSTYLLGRGLLVELTLFYVAISAPKLNPHFEKRQALGRNDFRSCLVHTYAEHHGWTIVCGSFSACDVDEPG